MLTTPDLIIAALVFGVLAIQQFNVALHKFDQKQYFVHMASAVGFVAMMGRFVAAALK